MYYINCFFIYSIFGYILETIVAFLTHTNFKSGILSLWWTPVYGIGAVTILFISNYLFKNLHMNRVYETIIVFVVVAITLSVIEVLGGVLIEKTFGITFWNYSNHMYPVGKYISLEMTIIWGLSSIVFIYVIHPVLNNLIKKIPNWITTLLIIIFIYDVTKTIIVKKKN
ncbi:MAG: putative ABC transporter permease [Bacilli bacterium]|nr:putative ABC transporter permease [Bacilli bacterium]